MGFLLSFYRHVIAQVSLFLLICIDEIVFIVAFSRHGIAQASLAMLIWLNENVGLFKSTVDNGDLLGIVDSAQQFCRR